MSSVFQELRDAAEPYKSFPKAVVALIRAAFDRGATEVKVGLYEQRSGSPCLVVADNGIQLTEAQQLELTSLEQAAQCGFPDNIGIGVVHHALELAVHVDDRIMYAQLEEGRVVSRDFHSNPHAHVEICFLGLGNGEGVNPRQDRSARRLVRELPRLLSPSEAQGTTVGENGETFSLVPKGGSKRIHKDGYAIDMPGEMVGYGSMGGLTLKYGPVRVTIAKFLSKVHLTNDEHEQLSILTSPWARGVIELTPHKSEEAVLVPVPTHAADDFESAYYTFEGGGASSLARTLLAAAVPDALIHQMGKLLMDSVDVFATKSRPLTLGGKPYQIGYAIPSVIKQGQGLVLWKDPTSSEEETRLLVDVTHPVFRTIAPLDEVIMQVLWWQLAMWIQFHDQEVFAGEPDAQVRTNMIYLALREHNPERSWDE